MPADDYVDLFNDETTRLREKHAPLKQKTRRLGRNDYRWLSDDARSAKRRCRRLERRFRRTRSATDKLAFNQTRTTAREAIAKSPSDDITQRFSDAAGDCAATRRVARDVLHRGKRPVYGDNESRTLVTGFSEFFCEQATRHPSVNYVQSAASGWTLRVYSATARRTGTFCVELHNCHRGAKRANIFPSQAFAARHITSVTAATDH